MIYPRLLTKPLPNDAKSPLPVDVGRQKRLLLKLPKKRETLRSRFGYLTANSNLQFAVGGFT